MLDSVSSRLAMPAAAKPAAADAAKRPTAPARTDVLTSPPGPASITNGNDISRQLSQSAPVDGSRVLQLRQLLQAGNFPVQADRIAEAMIASLKA